MDWLNKAKPCICPVCLSPTQILPCGEALTSTDINQDPAGWPGHETAKAVPKSDTTCLHKKSQAGSFCCPGGKEEEASSKACREEQCTCLATFHSLCLTRVAHSHKERDKPVPKVQPSMQHQPRELFGASGTVLPQPSSTASVTPGKPKSPVCPAHHLSNSSEQQAP